MANKTPRAAAAVSHTAGIFADMTLDGPEIGTLVVVVDRAKNLPNRKTMGKQDPYCAMRLGKEAKKTDTDRRGGQTPRWDQELRFTVHDSPDYYKLKVSCFNDDKRTDLIGEAFISLNDLIKPGGGSNDLWHQLNYKGRYAGDIRIEMTYYDMRPREEKPAEKRRHREKSIAGFEQSAGSPSGLSGPRQLGPREARRRPLPANPGQVGSSTNTLPQPLPPQPLMPSQPVASNGPNDQHQMYEPYHQEHEEFLPPHTNQTLTQPTYQDFPADEYNDYRTGNLPPRPMMTEPFRPDADLMDIVPPETHPEPALPDLSMAESRSHRRRSHLPVEDELGSIPPDHATSTYHDYIPGTTDDRPLPHVPLHHQPATYSEYALPNLAAPPNVSNDHAEEPEIEDAAPPQPPKHQNPPRKQQTEYPPSSFVIKPLRPIPIQPTVEERSPLQNIEHTFKPSSTVNMQVYSQVTHELEETLQGSHPGSEHAIRRSGSYIAESQQYPAENTSLTRQYPPALQPTDDRRKSQFGYQLNYEQGYEDLTERHGRRNSFNPFQQDLPEKQMPALPNRPRSYDDQLPQHKPDQQSNQMYSSSPHAHSMPLLPQVEGEAIRSRPQKRQPGQVPPRKAVSPNPYQEDPGSRYPEEAGGRRLSGVPFGPSAYDVLNPASSQVTNEHTQFETPEQARQSARLRESRLADDIGPIIDNDGRVIDPSDHLPTSSWAPEPERKQRKPEHVIHYRTKADGRNRTTPASSPASLRMHMHRNHPMTPTTGSPMSVSSSSGRHTTHNTPPSVARPLPAQPFKQPHSNSSPVVDQSPSQRFHRNSYQESTSSMQRPALSEYQVPVQNNYTPRGAAYSQYQMTPQRLSLSSGRCSQNFDDPLAAEMSMIDIGPSRNNRTAFRMSRGY